MRRENVLLHFHGHMLWQNTEQEALQLFIFVLHLESGVDAVASVQKGLAASSLHEMIREETDHVDSQKDDRVRYDL